MNQAGARADIQWRPNFPFSYSPVEGAMSMIGVGLNEIRIKVRGTISHDDSNFWLVSIGDGTKFVLLSPLKPVSGQYSEYYNIESHKLTEVMRYKLYDAELANQIAIIEGPVFQPERSPPLTLIIEKFQFEQKE